MEQLAELATLLPDLVGKLESCKANILEALLVDMPVRREWCWLWLWVAVMLVPLALTMVRVMWSRPQKATRCSWVRPAASWAEQCTRRHLCTAPTRRAWPESCCS